MLDVQSTLNAEQYRDEILANYVHTQFENHAWAYRLSFMQDGAIPHTIRFLRVHVGSC